jgi:FlaA1/EpsC-like NDP-sugar epimerase
MLAKIGAWPRAAKRTLMYGADTLAIPLALWSAIVVKSDALVVPAGRTWALFAVAIVAAVTVFQWTGLYRLVVRFVVPRAGLAIMSGVLASVLALALADAIAPGPRLPVSVLATYLVFAATLVAGSRWLAAMLLNLPVSGGGRDPVIIYGAGDAGRSVADALTSSREFRLVGFVDDDPSLQDMVIKGARVHSPASIGALVQKSNVRRILLALPSVTRRRRREILERLQPLGVRVQTVPEVAEIVSGRSQLAEIREVDVRDLLGRDPVPPNVTLLDACIRGKSVVVTGAGGSIGSELCRQIVQHDPETLVLLDISEAALYNIERELTILISARRTRVRLVALIGSAHHRLRVREMLQAFRVQTVYHAAAYKHVPLVEQNMIEGIQNNVISTWYMAETAAECNVETFVLISSDKAVNPTNVMGATKRYSELILQALQQRGGKTRFCMVRFGNVLASSGSVVPLFQQQIRGGGPITVTHPDVIRYFMTIEEAIMLVIQAGSMAKGGDVFVLDMGKPVRIAELAERMIRLAGLTVRDTDRPDGDIEIVYTGLRPAEKLFEELLIGTNVSGTEHPRILRAMEDCRTWEKLQPMLRELAATIQAADCTRARELLCMAMPEYGPVEPIQDLVWTERNGGAPSMSDDLKVTRLSAVRTRLTRSGDVAGIPPRL